MNDLLTREEMEEITGARQWAKMAKNLSENGIYYILREDGEIRVTWHHVHNPTRIDTSNEPDFDSIG